MKHDEMHRRMAAAGWQLVRRTRGNHFLYRDEHGHLTTVGNVHNRRKAQRYIRYAAAHLRNARKQ